MKQRVLREERDAARERKEGEESGRERERERVRLVFDDDGGASGGCRP